MLLIGISIAVALATVGGVLLIVFRNRSGVRRALTWIDFRGVQREPHVIGEPSRVYPTFAVGIGVVLLVFSVVATITLVLTPH